MANLLAQYIATSGAVERPQPELMLTITPRFASIIAGVKARITFTVPATFTFSTASTSDCGTSHKGALGAITAALLMTRSGVPCEARTLSPHRDTAAASVTLTASKRCGDPNSSRNSARSFFDRAQAATWWPWQMNHSTKARPHPRLHPVTTISLSPLPRLMLPILPRCREWCEPSLFAGIDALQDEAARPC